MRPFDLICFDVDGTLIDHPEGKVVWQILNKRFTGSDAANDLRFVQYTQGTITYEQWVALDVGDWQRAGATRQQIVEALEGLALVEGARETVWALKGEGCLLAVVSGTLDICIDVLFPDHPFDEVYTNRLFFDGAGGLSGWKATPFDMDGKAVAIRRLRERHGFAPHRCAFVGDNHNDIAAAREAGFSIAFNPRSSQLEQASDVVVRSADLRAILPHLSRGSSR